VDTKSVEISLSSANSLVGNDLIRYQLKIAKRWQKKGRKSKNVFAKFLFYYMGFNALYFIIEKTNNRKNQKEINYVENLLRKIDQIKADKILDKIMINVKYFCNRPPIQEMRKRTFDSPYEGCSEKGREYKENLKNICLPGKDRIVALGQILYLVRCNLVHGSKSASGDDSKVIRMSILPLKIFLEEAMRWASQEYKITN
jgi:hypothetical protein